MAPLQAFQKHQKASICRAFEAASITLLRLASIRPFEDIPCVQDASPIGLIFVPSGQVFGHGLISLLHHASSTTSFSTSFSMTYGLPHRTLFGHLAR